MLHSCFPCLGLLCFLLLFALLCFLFGRRRFFLCRGNCPEWMREYPYAHRGLHGEGVDENSLSSFRLAAERKCAIELDVRLTADGIPVISHNNSLYKTTGKKALISNLRYDELIMYPLLKSGENIPSLEEVLSTIDDKVPLLIELKSFSFSRMLEYKVCGLLQKYEGRCAVQSFNPVSLNAVRRHGISVPVGLLLNDIPGFPTCRPLRIVKDNLLMFLCRPAFLSYNMSCLQTGELNGIRNRKTVILGWTCTYKELERKGYLSTVDAIIFE